jgi:hypothetical protein
MRKLLFALLLSSSLSALAHGQQKASDYRQGDAFRGPVRSARIERATYSRVDGRLVEGARQLVSVSNYAPDGKRREGEGYAPDGTLRSRYVHLYDDAGREVEMSVFDGEGELQMRKVHLPSTGETLTFNGDGSLRERRVVIKRPDGTQAETRLYDGSGALKERSVNERDGKTSVWSTYGADGSLRKQDVHSLNYGGPHRTETKHFAPDGSVVGRRVSDVDAAISDLRATSEGVDGRQPKKMRETRDYDPRRNLSKLTTFRWNAEAGEYEPSAVSYYTIEYYR